MEVLVDESDVKTCKADSRGRVNLGTDVADETLEVAILEVKDDGPD